MLPEAAQEASGRIAESYTPLAISRAFQAWNRSRTLSLDDLIGAACEGLMVGIRKYAEKDAHLSFANYAEVIIKSFLSREIAAQLYRTNLLSGWERDLVSKYKKGTGAEAETSEKGRPKKEIAEVLGTTATELTIIRRVIDTPLSYEGAQERLGETVFSERVHTTAETDPKKEVMLERALLLLPPGAADLVRKRFGIDGPAYTVQEIMEMYRLKDTSVRNKISRSLEQLAAIIPQLEQGTLDLLQWRTENPSRKNVLVFLAMIGKTIPPDASLVELRLDAMDVLRNSGASPSAQRLLADMYGLKDGSVLSGQEIARKNGIRPGSIYALEKQALRAVGTVVDM